MRMFLKNLAVPFAFAFLVLILTRSVQLFIGLFVVAALGAAWFTYKERQRQGQEGESEARMAVRDAWPKVEQELETLINRPLTVEEHTRLLNQPDVAALTLIVDLVRAAYSVGYYGELIIDALDWKLKEVEYLPNGYRGRVVSVNEDNTQIKVLWEDTSEVSGWVDKTEFIIIEDTWALKQILPS